MSPKPEYQVLAEKLFSGEVPASFLALLEITDNRIKKMKPWGSLRSSQIVAVLYMKWLTTQHDEDSVPAP